MNTYRSKIGYQLLSTESGLIDTFMSEYEALEAMDRLNLESDPNEHNEYYTEEVDIDVSDYDTEWHEQQINNDNY